MTTPCFHLPPSEPRDRTDDAPGKPRIQRPDRARIELRPVDLDGLLPADHRARLVWALWFVLAHNLMRAVALRATAAIA